jgi:hypothetical protein
MHVSYLLLGGGAQARLGKRALLTKLQRPNCGSNADSKMENRMFESLFTCSQLNVTTCKGVKVYFEVVRSERNYSLECGAGRAVITFDRMNWTVINAKQRRPTLPITRSKVPAAAYENLMIRRM